MAQALSLKPRRDLGSSSSLSLAPTLVVRPLRAKMRRSVGISVVAVARIIVSAGVLLGLVKQGHAGDDGSQGNVAPHSGPVNCPYQLDHKGAERGFFESLKPQAVMEAVVAAGSCNEVMAEVQKRANNSDGWQTPGLGSYVILNPNKNQDDNSHPHVMEIEHRSWLGGVTSRMALTFVWAYTQDKDNEYCRVFGCSQSRGHHASDGGRNYCNLRDMICDTHDDYCRGSDTEEKKQDMNGRVYTWTFSGGAKKVNPRRCGLDDPTPPVLL